MVCISVPVAATAAVETAGMTAAETAFLASATAASGVTAAGGTLASTLATAGTVASLVGSGVSALGMLQSSKAGAQAAKYNASVAAVNQQIAQQNSDRAALAGSAAVEAQQLKTRNEVGQITSNMAASGLDTTTGSAADVINSATQIGQLNALSIRANATQQAYSYKNQSASYGADAGLETSKAANDITSGYLSSGSTILSGVGDAGLTYGKFLSNKTF